MMLMIFLSLESTKFPAKSINLEFYWFWESNLFFITFPKMISDLLIIDLSI